MVVPRRKRGQAAPLAIQVGFLVGGGDASTQYHSVG